MSDNIVNGKARHNWEELKREFMLGEWLQVSTFAVDKGISNKVIYEKAKGWAEEKRQKRLETTNKAVEIKAHNDLELSIAQAEQSRTLTLRGINKLRAKAETMIETVKTAKDLNDLASVYFRVNDVESRLMVMDKAESDTITRELTSALLEAARAATEGEE